MKFIVYSKNNCKYCEQSKNEILEFFENNAKKEDKELLDVIYVDNDAFTVDDLKSLFKEKGLPEPKTVPCIFYKENNSSEEIFIGGYSSLQSFLKELREGN